MTPQLGVIAAWAVFTVHHPCAASRHSESGKKDDLLVVTSISGEGESHDEAHTIDVYRPPSEDCLEVKNIAGGKQGKGEGTAAMAAIVRMALELVPEPKDDEPRVRLHSGHGNDLFWILMGMAPDEGILPDKGSLGGATPENVVVHFAQQYQGSGVVPPLLEELMSTAFGIGREEVIGGLNGTDLGELLRSTACLHVARIDPARVSAIGIPEQLLLASFWYVVRVAERLNLKLPTQGKLVADLNSYIADFSPTQPGACVADVIDSLGPYNYMLHEYVPELLKKLEEKVSAPKGEVVMLDMKQEYHLSPEGRQRWIDAFKEAEQPITRKQDAIKPGEYKEFEATDADGEVAGDFMPFYDLQHLKTWMTAPQQQWARELNELRRERAGQRATAARVLFHSNQHPQHHQQPQ